MLFLDGSGRNWSGLHVTTAWTNFLKTLNGGGGDMTHAGCFMPVAVDKLVLAVPEHVCLNGVAQDGPVVLAISSVAKPQ